MVKFTDGGNIFSPGAVRIQQKRENCIHEQKADILYCLVPGVQFKKLNSVSKYWSWMIPNTGRNVQKCHVSVIPMTFDLKQTPKSKLYTQGMKGRPFSFPIIYPSHTHVWYPFCARVFCIVSSAADDALPLVSTMWHVVSHSVPW